MKCIVGLGNPGKKYEKTRHNLGRLLTQQIAVKRKQKFVFKKKLQSYTAKFSHQGNDVLLAVPDVYMNLSGEPVVKLVRHFDLNVSEDILVVVDDLDLPFGSVRLRSKGGCGGHNGLLSLIEILGTEDFPRLRIGIGRPPEIEDSDIVSEYVLSNFFQEEQAKLPNVLQKAEEASYSWLELPMAKAMSIVNA